MPIDSVGPKMMVQSATEVAKDASILQKRGDMMQSAAAQQTQTEAERMAAEVVDVYEPEGALIQRERERREQERREREEKDEKDSAAKKQKLPEIAQVHTKIDIRI